VAVRMPARATALQLHRRSSVDRDQSSSGLAAIRVSAARTNLSASSHARPVRHVLILAFNG
jgi:hypothetical protein